MTPDLKQRTGHAGIAVLASLLLFMLPASHAHSDSEKLDKQLIERIAEKDLQGARRALEAGADPEALVGEDDSDSAVCVAIDDRGTEFLELLIDYGASVDSSTGHGRYGNSTPLECAIYYYHPAAFKLLLNRGAVPEESLCDGCASRFAVTACKCQSKSATICR